MNQNILQKRIKELEEKVDELENRPVLRCESPNDLTSLAAIIETYSIDENKTLPGMSEVVYKNAFSDQEIQIIKNKILEKITNL